MFPKCNTHNPTQSLTKCFHLRLKEYKLKGCSFKIHKYGFKGTRKENVRSGHVPKQSCLVKANTKKSLYRD